MLQSCKCVKICCMYESRPTRQTHKIDPCEHEKCHTKQTHESTKRELHKRQTRPFLCTYPFKNVSNIYIKRDLYIVWKSPTKETYKAIFVHVSVRTDGEPMLQMCQKYVLKICVKNMSKEPYRRDLSIYNQSCKCVNICSLIRTTKPMLLANAANVRKICVKRALQKRSLYT